MKKVNFQIKGDSITLVPIADVHIGSPQFDETLFKKVCDYVMDNKAYVILNGDIVDNCTRNSIGDVFSATMSPASQVALACNYLAPIAKAGRIINFVNGNHEFRSDKDTGLSPSDLILAHLMKYDDSLNDRYSPDSCFTFLSFQPRNSTTKKCVTIFNLHGSGGGAKIGGKIARLDDMQSIVPADIYIRSHTHQPETHHGVNIDVNRNSYTVKEEDCLFVNTNAYLRTLDGYGNRMGMKPMSMAIPIIKIKLARKREGKIDAYKKILTCELVDMED